MVADKGYHSNENRVLELKELGLRGVSCRKRIGRDGDELEGEEPEIPTAPVYGESAADPWRARPAIAATEERTLGERPFAHSVRATGGLRRIFVRGHPNGRKRLLGHVCGFNRGLLLRPRTGFGTPRSLQGRTLPSILAPLARWSGLQRLLKRCCASIRPGPSIVASHIHRYTINMSTCE